MSGPNFKYKLPPSAAAAGVARPAPPGGIPASILAYALCLVPISIFAGWVVTYGQDEEALEKKLREKYGPEIHQVESRKQAMSDVYIAAIKNPGSSSEQEARLNQVLRGGRGEAKRHYVIDRKYYGTPEGKERQLESSDRMVTHQEEERQKSKRIKKRLKRLKKKQQQQEEENGGKAASASGSVSDSDASTSTISSDKKKVAAATAVAALALASAADRMSSSSEENNNKTTTLQTTTAANPFKKVNAKISSKKKKEKVLEKKKDQNTRPGLDLTQVVTLTAVAGTAALVGFLVGGGSRR